MLLLEQDAKELLAIQGIPVPGAIRLAQIPAVGEAEDGSPSGPWIVKPQILAASSAGAASAVAARTNAEVAAAAAALLNQTVGGEVVHSVLIERRMAARGTACLSFRCDPAAAGIRIDVGAGGARFGDVAAPDPTAVIACVDGLSASLDGEARACVAEAGRMLAPLYFGYEAALLEIDPLMILADRSWAVGDVHMALDENALFRHPELISLVERRPHAYADIRQLRAHGIDHRILDTHGAVATIVAGAGHAAHLLDALTARGLTPYNFMDAGPAALDGAPERLIAAIDLLAAAPSPRCVLFAAGAGVVDLAAFAAQLAAALAARPAFAKPLVAHLAGAGAGAAGAILQQAYPAAHFEPDLDAALDTVARAVGEPG